MKKSNLIIILVIFAAATFFVIKKVPVEQELTTNADNEVVTPPERIDQPMRSAFRFGERKPVDGANIEIEYVDMLEESRCLPNTQCFQEGKSRVLVKIYQKDLVEQIEMEYPNEQTDITPIFGYNISLDRVEYTTKEIKEAFPPKEESILYMSFVDSKVY